MLTDSSVTKLHLSLNVGDLQRAVEFYRSLFGIEPAKAHSDYAKFELDTPPLVLSLIPGRVAPGGALNHAGLRLLDSGTLLDMQHRLEAAGIRTHREDGVECCHSRQTKFWVTDPDKTLWEIYVLEDGEEDEGDAVLHPAPHAEERENTPQGVPRVVWHHHIGEPLPARIPHDEHGVHEIFLEGTVNLSPDGFDLAALFADCLRVLRPGGEIRVHGLAGDAPFPGDLPPLPGPAAVVEHVPTVAELLRALRAAGFVALRCEKLSPQAYFNLSGVPMREVQIAGEKPGHRPRTQAHHAIYLGPLASVTDDFGNVFPRGERVALNVHDWLALSRSAVSGQFLLQKP